VTTSVVVVVFAVLTDFLFMFFELIL